MEVRKAKKAMARRRDEPARTEMGLGWPCNPKGANGKPRIGSSANEQYAIQVAFPGKQQVFKVRE